MIRNAPKLKPRTDAKYLHLVNHVTAQISSKRLRAGDRLPTFLELQERFGVTSPTVNRAMIALEQQGLVERKRGSGVYVTGPSRNTRHGIIGISGYGFRFSGQSSYWATLLEGVREQAAKTATQVLLLDYETSNGWEKADGVLICDWGSKETLRYVPPGLPCVSVLALVENMASVAADDYNGVRAATDHLVQLGHRRVAYLHNTNGSLMLGRLDGYRDALKAFGVKPRARWKRVLPKGSDYGEQFICAGRDAMAKWLREDWSTLGCTSLLCQNDETAVGALEALREAGLRVPQDVSVIGFDGMAIGNYVTPKLTTVEIPLQDIGARAMELLHRQITKDEVCAEHQMLPTQLRVRESTAAPP